MNINDIADPKEIPAPHELLPAIFDKQRSLMEKYEVIERGNGIDVPEITGDLDDPRVQNRIKDFFWRATEELAEANEAPPDYFPHPVMDYWGKNSSVDHSVEELIDALHFMVEAAIISKYPPAAMTLAVTTELGQVKQAVDGPMVPSSMLEKSMCHVVTYMGLAANTLKNKPWKQTHMPTDTAKFFMNLEMAFISLFRFFAMLGISLPTVYVLYTRKNEVNKWRQETKY